MHVPFVFILDEGVSTGFARVGVIDHSDAFDRSVRLEFSSQFRFRCVVVDSSDEEGLEGISGGVGVRVRVPQSQILKREFNSIEFIQLSYTARLKTKRMSVWRNGKKTQIQQENTLKVFLKLFVKGISHS